MSETIESKANKVKKELAALFTFYKESVIMNEIALENNQIPEGLSKEQFKRKVAKDRSILNRNCIDRLWLEHLGILPTIKTNKSKKHKLDVRNKMSCLKNLNKQEQILIDTILKDLEQ